MAATDRTILLLKGLTKTFSGHNAVDHIDLEIREGEFVVSVEIDPPRGGNAESMLELARTLHASPHVDVVDVNDNPRARARMNGLFASAISSNRE